MTCDVSGYVSHSLCNLYNWRYKHLGNLPHVQQLPEFQVPNPGLTFDFQLINVEDFNGVGESEPNPYFYQVSGTHHSTPIHTDYFGGGCLYKKLFLLYKPTTKKMTKAA